MLFRSKAPAHIAFCRAEKVDWSMGFKQVIWPSLEADFGQDFGSEQINSDLHDFGGNNFATAQIRGGVFDSEVAQKANGWTDEERQIVERRLLEFAADTKYPGEVWLYEPPKAEPPWPTYDDVHHNTIPELAASLGLVQEAIIYEQRRENPRATVIERLTAELERQEQEKTLVAQ